MSRFRLVTTVVVCMAVGASLGPAVSIAQTAVQDVRVVNTGAKKVPVNVFNDATRPLHTREVERARPFQAGASVVMPASEQYQYAEVDVPTGYRMVVEYISAWTASGRSFNRAGVTSGGLQTPIILLPATRGSLAGPVQFRQPNPGDLTVYADRFGFASTDHLAVNVDVFGYLVPEPTTASTSAAGTASPPGLPGS